MLSNLQKNPSDKPCNTIDTLIGANTDIKGDISFTGGLRIDGKVRGNVTAKGDNNSTLVLSENAQITGNVTAPHIITNGSIKGNVRCAERMELQTKAEVAGDVSYKVMEMAIGAVINGNLVRDLTESSRNVAKLRSVTGGEDEDEG